MTQITRLPVLLLVVYVLLAPGLLAAQDAPYPDHPEILWDTWGVPHIFSPDTEGLFYAFGWAQAQNHGDLILRLYGQARGRAAEYWGEDYLESDLLVRTLAIPQQGVSGYEALPDDFKANVDAFAAGVNAYVTAFPERIGDEWQVVAPISASDVLAHGVRTLRYLFVAGAGVNHARQWGPPPQFGSNAWAVGPSRSASGHAMLVANPHQPWEDLGLWIEAHLVAPGVNVYGAALVGQPVLGIAFNEFLGWTHTVNTRDGWDLYELTLTDDMTGYLYDGAEVPFDVRRETILARQDDGTLTETILPVLNSVHGPVLAVRDDGTALAIRVVAENASEAGIQWWEMGLATSFEQFEAAIRPIRIPMFTFMYADRDGNIMHLFNEQVPLRAEGDWAFWNNTTVIDGSNPAILPGDSSRYVWSEYHPYEDLPRLVNPETGWLQNANEPPWTATFPLGLDPADYPAYMAPPPYIWPRPITSMRLLYEDDSITFDELVEYKHSTYIELARLVLADLIAAAQASESDLLRQAAGVLSAWDGRADADSVGAVLFILWANDYISELGFDAFASAWDVNDPIYSLHGLADPEGAAAALETAAAELERIRPLAGAGMDIAYGQVFRLRVGEFDLPANGTEDLLGSFRILTFTQDPDLRFRPVHGDSYIAVIEFADPVRAQVLLSYGNATQPGSPHVGDQLELFARQELREAWLTRDQIEANLEARQVFEDR